MLATLTKLRIERSYIQNNAEIDKQVFDGEVEMDPQQQDYYRGIIGDAKASVTASRTLSHKDYGSGGDVFVSVTLTCGQTGQEISSAIDLAKQMAEWKAWQHLEELKTQLVQRGILRG